MNKVALITGGSRGIGKAIASELASRNYDVAINYASSSSKAEQLGRDLEQNYGITTIAIKADVGNESKVDKMIEEIEDKFGRIDVLVNNAGIAIDKGFDEYSVEDWQKTLQTNLIGPFLVSKIVGRKMMKRKTGKIINIASTNGINAFFPTSVAYDASKAGLINLTHNLAIQFAPYVNVNAVAPGWVNTDMNKDLPADLIKEETAKIYKKRWAEPEEIAKVVAFLASDEAEYVNDEIIKVDGGYNG